MNPRTNVVSLYKYTMILNVRFACKAYTTEQYAPYEFKWYVTAIKELPNGHIERISTNLHSIFSESHSS